MRTKIIAFLLLCGMAGYIFPARAQIFEVQQLLLDIEKLSQLKSILKDMKEGYQVLDKGYSVIRDISKGSFDLHKAFLDGLLAVSPAVREYKRVGDIVSLQLSLVKRYQSVWAKFSQDKHFRPEEIEVIGNMYANLFKQSLKDLDALATVVTDGAMRADDAERLRQIDGIWTGLQKKSMLLERFSGSTMVLSMQRASDQADMDGIRKLYGFSN